MKTKTEESHLISSSGHGGFRGFLGSAYLPAAASPVPGPGCLAGHHAAGGRRCFPSDLFLPPGREESDREGSGAPPSPGLKLDGGIRHADFLSGSSHPECLRRIRTFERELQNGLVRLHCCFVERGPTSAVRLGKAVPLLDAQLLQELLITWTDEGRCRSNSHFNTGMNYDST